MPLSKLLHSASLQDELKFRLHCHSPCPHHYPLHSFPSPPLPSLFLSRLLSHLACSLRVSTSVRLARSADSLSRCFRSVCVCPVLSVSRTLTLRQPRPHSHLTQTDRPVFDSHRSLATSVPPFPQTPPPRSLLLSLTTLAARVRHMGTKNCACVRLCARACAQASECEGPTGMRAGARSEGRSRVREVDGCTGPFRLRGRILERPAGRDPPIDRPRPAGGQGHGE